MAQESLGFFELMMKSMFDFKFYKRFVGVPMRKTILYIVLFGLFIGSLGMIKHTVYYNDYFNDIRDDIIKRVPEFKVENGLLVMDEDVSFIRKEEDFEFVIDPNVTSDSLESDELIGIYMTKDAFVLRSLMSNDIIKYDGSDSSLINKASILEYLVFFKNVTLGVILILGTIVGMIVKMINSLFVSLIGMLINRVHNYQMSFKKVYQIGVHALTFPSIVALFADIFLMNMPFFTIIYFVVIVLYYTKIFKVLREEA